MRTVMSIGVVAVAALCGYAYFSSADEPAAAAAFPERVMTGRGAPEKFPLTVPDAECTNYSVALATHAVALAEQFDADATKIVAQIGADSNTAIIGGNAATTDEQKAAWFALASYCSRDATYFKISPALSEVLDDLSPAQCRKIPAQYKKNPVSLLRPEPGNNSAELALLYAENLLVTSRLLSFTPTSDTATLVENMRREAETQGRKAAKLGSSKALLFMAQQYETGAFGQKDLKQSLVFLHALRDVEQSTENTVRMAYVVQQMTANDYKEVVSGLVRCAALGKKQEGLLLSNPFG